MCATGRHRSRYKNPQRTRKSPDASGTVPLRPVVAAVPVQELFADADQLRMAVARPPAQYSAGTRLAGTGGAECAVADGAGRAGRKNTFMAIMTQRHEAEHQILNLCKRYVNVKKLLM